MPNLRNFLAPKMSLQTASTVRRLAEAASFWPEPIRLWSGPFRRGALPPRPVRSLRRRTGIRRLTAMSVRWWMRLSMRGRNRRCRPRCVSSKTQAFTHTAGANSSVPPRARNESDGTTDWRIASLMRSPLENAPAAQPGRVAFGAGATRKVATARRELRCRNSAAWFTSWPQGASRASG